MALEEAFKEDVIQKCRRRRSEGFFKKDVLKFHQSQRKTPAV